MCGAAACACIWFPCRVDDWDVHEAEGRGVASGDVGAPEPDLKPDLESHLKDLNLRPSLYKSDALPTELRWRRRKYRGLGRGNHAAAAGVGPSRAERLLSVGPPLGRAWEFRVWRHRGMQNERQISEVRVSEGSDVQAGG